MRILDSAGVTSCHEYSELKSRSQNQVVPSYLMAISSAEA